MRFVVKTVDHQNRVVAVRLHAADKNAARDAASRHGHIVLSVEHASVLSSPLSGSKRVFPTLLFSVELLALLSAGLNVVEAMRALLAKERTGETQRVLDEMLEALYRGESLSQAVAAQPQAFPALYVATLKTCEHTGNLKDALSRYITYREEIDRVKKKITAALIYPSLLLIVGTMVLAFLMFYVVPRFASVYQGVSRELPFFSSVLFTVGRWVQANGVLVLAVCVGTSGALAYTLFDETRRARLLDRLWRVPTLGERLRIYQLSRFYRSVGMLLHAGVPALKALDMVSGLLTANLRAPLSRAMSLLNEGRSISAALTTVGFVTPVATEMMAVGERSGQVGEMMERIAYFYEEDIARFLDTFMRTFEPLLMVALGLAVGVVVVLMYMPIFELAGSIQ